MKKIESLLAKSNLSGQDQNELLVAFQLLSEDEREELYDFLLHYPEWVDKLHRNYNQKKVVAGTGDYNKWKEIFDEEKKELVDGQ